MILKQFYLNCLAQASYLVGDDETQTAAIIDPRRDIDVYVEEAARRRLHIRYVFLTHFHADFIAGHLELRDRLGARIYLGVRARAEYDFTPMADGESLAFGRVRLQVLETPGHTAESISILVFDLEEDAGKPVAVLTGDTLFVGDVGRPDLRASLGWSATELGAMLYESVHSKLLRLPDDTLVYPAHGAGSLCGKHIAPETVSTIGHERRSNYALQPMKRDDFLALVTVDQPEAPPYFTYDAVLNAQERPTLETVLEQELKPLPIAEVLDRQERGAEVLDTRGAADFANGHLRGSVNVGLDGSFATWAGTIMHRDRPIVIITAPGREKESATRLARIGFDNVAGYLDGGIATLENHLDLVERTLRVTATDLAGELSSPDPPQILDVRTPLEWQSKHIEGSRNVPLNALGDVITELPHEGRFAILCAGGYRSSIAASLAERRGFHRVIELAGGMAAWEAAALPMQGTDVR